MSKINFFIQQIFAFLNLNAFITISFGDVFSYKINDLYILKNYTEPGNIFILLFISKINKLLFFV